MINSKIAYLMMFIFIFAGCTATVTVGDLCLKTIDDLTKTVAEWYYCGTKDGYHYFYNSQIGFGSDTYRVKKNDLKLIRTFPATKDKDRWILLPWGSPNPGNLRKIQNLVVDNEQNNCFSPIILNNNIQISIEEIK
jgi:hypothetical protein